MTPRSLGLWAGALIPLALASPAAAQDTSQQIVPYASRADGPRVLTQPVAIWGLDSVSGAKCIVGSTATCSLPGTGGGTGASVPTGSAGTPNANVVTFQGVPGGTPAPTAQTYTDQNGVVQTDGVQTPHPMVDQSGSSTFTFFKNVTVASVSQSGAFAPTPVAGAWTLDCEATSWGTGVTFTLQQASPIDGSAQSTAYTCSANTTYPSIIIPANTPVRGYVSGGTANATGFTATLKLEAR